MRAIHRDFSSMKQKKYTLDIDMHSAASRNFPFVASTGRNYNALRSLVILGVFTSPGWFINY